LFLTDKASTSTPATPAAVKSLTDWFLATKTNSSSSTLTADLRGMNVWMPQTM